MKYLFLFLIIITVLVGGYFLLKETKITVMENEVDDSLIAIDLVKYFSERIIKLGIEDLGMNPIEGFNAYLLIKAFPGLQKEDFDEVETFGGHYEYDFFENDLNFVRDEDDIATSADETVSEKGYQTLLKNISERLNFEINNKIDIEELLEDLNTGESITLRIKQEGNVLNIQITVLEILEDSRCPIGAQCVQAGTVRVRATLESGLGTADQIFTLGETVTTEAEEVTLARVLPEAQLDSVIQESDYIFYFEVKSR